MSFTLAGGFADGYANQRYRADLTVTGTYTLPLSFDAAGSSLPAWVNVLVYSGNKVLVWGTPTSGGAALLAVSIKDASTPSISALATAKIMIAPPPPPAGVTTAVRALRNADGVLLADNSAAIWNTTTTLPGSTTPATLYGVTTNKDGSVEYDIQVDESIGLGDTLSAEAIYSLLERLGIGAQANAQMNTTARVTERLGFADVVRIAYVMLTNEQLAIGGDLAAWQAMAMGMVDTLALSAGVGCQLNAQVAVAAAIAFGDSIANVIQGDIAEALGVGDAANAQLTATMAMLDQLRVEAALTGTVTFAAQVNEALVFDATLSVGQVLQALITEQIGLLGEIALDDGVYLAWVVNTESHAFTRYINYPFNSFARIGDKYYGAKDDGLYLLEGDDDAGTPIEAFLRSGLSDMGSSLMKRVLAGYVGIRSDGDMLLKVTVTNDEGGREEHWYSMEQRPSSALRMNRVSPGKGLKSVYWGWTLANVNGADFDLDSFAWYPMVLERRLG